MRFHPYRVDVTKSLSDVNPNQNSNHIVVNYFNMKFVGLRGHLVTPHDAYSKGHECHHSNVLDLDVNDGSHPSATVYAIKITGSKSCCCVVTVCLQ